MNIKSSRALVFGQTVLVGFVVLLSTVAMSSNQTTPTPTATVTPTNTPLSTPTFTATPTSTPTFTLSPVPTPACPSASEIKDTLQDQFKKMNDRLDRITNESQPSHWVNIGDNLIANIIWSPLTWLWGILIGGLSFVRRKNRQDKIDGRAARYTELEELLSSVSKFVLIILVAYFLIPALFQFGQLLVQVNNQVELNSISQKLDHIENQLSGLFQATPSSPYNPNYSPNFPANNIPDWQAPLGVSIGLLFLFVGIAIFISRNQARVYDITFPNIDWQEMGRELLPAIFLVMILYLLPYPIDTLLLPILIPFFIFAFFDVIALLPNRHLKELVTRYHPLIIFIAVFGAWNGVFEFIHNQAYPVWNVISGSLQNAFAFFIHNQNAIQRPSFVSEQLWDYLPYSITTLAWGLLPLLLAILFAISSSRQIWKIAREKYIPKIAESVDSHR